MGLLMEPADRAGPAALPAGAAAPGAAAAGGAAAAAAMDDDDDGEMQLIDEEDEEPAQQAQQAQQQGERGLGAAAWHGAVPAACCAVLLKLFVQLLVWGCGMCVFAATWAQAQMQCSCAAGAAAVCCIQTSRSGLAAQEPDLCPAPTSLPRRLRGGG